MPEFPVDLSKKDADLIPEGIYPCAIDWAELRTSKAGGLYLNWQFTLADEEYMGRKVWMMTSLSEKASFVLSNTLVAMGFEDAADDSHHILLKVDDETNLLVNPPVSGRLVNVKITQETFEGKTRNKAASVVSSEALGQGTGSNGQDPLF